jgi:DNA-binding NtrC family response regulator
VGSRKVEAAIAQKPDLLIVDDDPLITDTLDFVLGKDFHIFAAGSRQQARAVIAQLDRVPGLALVDLGLPPTPHRPDEGFRLISELLAASPEIKIVVLSGQNDEANARHARTLGAVDFVAKPCEPAVLRQLLLRARNFGEAERAAPSDDGIVGKSFAIGKLREQIRQYATSPFPVLIEGESGSGKELVARALHRGGPRAARPYFALNCAAISPALVEPTLFGYAKGAFTGAVTGRSGYFEDAAEGTLFLDEIGELPLELQSKLLRVLENGEYQRVGETQLRMSAARVVAATNRDLRIETKAGRFRVDLYHRLSVFTIQVPPLRDLGEDKWSLLEHFGSRYAQQAGAVPCTLDDDAKALWMAYGFPGNVRELRNIVIRLTTKHAGQMVGRTELAEELDFQAQAGPGAGADDPFAPSVEAALAVLASRRTIDLDSNLREWEGCFVEAALQLTRGNLAQAARMLGMHRTTLYSRMQSRDIAASDIRVRPSTPA